MSGQELRPSSPGRSANIPVSSPGTLAQQVRDDAALTAGTLPREGVETDSHTIWQGPRCRSERAYQVYPVAADARLLGEIDDHPLVPRVRDDQVHGVDEGSRSAVGMGQDLQLAAHPLQVPLHPAPSPRAPSTVMSQPNSTFGRTIEFTWLLRAAGVGPQRVHLAAAVWGGDHHEGGGAAALAARSSFVR